MKGYFDDFIFIKFPIRCLFMKMRQSGVILDKVQVRVQLLHCY